MAQLEKTVYRMQEDPVVVESNAPATWFAGFVLVLVVMIIGGFAFLMNNSNNETAQELEKMQQDQANITLQSNLAAQSTQAQQDAVRRQQVSADALQAATQYRQNAKESELANREAQLTTPAPAPAPAPVPASAPDPSVEQPDTQVGH